MKKLLSILLALAMVFAFTACGGSDESEDAQVEEVGGATVANPMVEYESLEEIAEVVHCEMPTPGVMGVSDEKYFVINDEVAQYDFSVNGIPYTLRASYDYSMENMCGIYIDAEPAVTEVSGELAFVLDDEYKIATWCTMDGQYSLVVNDNGEIEEATFKEIAQYFCDETSLWMTDDELAEVYAGFEGSYQDSYSQRAVADMTADGSNGLKVLVHWGSSATESVQWELTLKATEDGLMSYNDCVKTIHTFSDDDEETVETEYENGEGYFVVTNGSFYWEGAAEEDCVDCVFEKVE